MKDLKTFVDEARMEPYCNYPHPGQFEEEIEKIFPKYMFYDTFNINYTPTDYIKMVMLMKTTNGFSIS